MNNWTPAALLPNLHARKPVNGRAVALVPSDDPRILAFCGVHQKLKELLSRFTDAFGLPLDPMVLIVHDDALPKLAAVEPLASFRDLIALSVIPFARSLSIVYGGKGRDRIYYSNSFWFYPWMLAKDNQHLTMSTPAVQAFHVVEEFCGQSSPELPTMELAEIDEPLFQILLKRWERYYLGSHHRREDSVLFRSLNMAVQAAQLPGGIDVTLYDIGRTIALWVSACEILAHTPPAGSGVRQVYALFDQISFVEPTVRERRYKAKGRRPDRATLPCWIYGKIYQARNDFLHGNPVRKDRLNFTGAETSLFWVAPCVYRLALTGFLKLSPMEARPGQFYTDPQHMMERALMRARKRK